MNFRKLLFIPCLALSSIIYAQNQEVIIRDIIESIAETLPEDYDLTELTELFNARLKHPLNLNKATTDELKVFVFLSPLQIQSFFTHKLENGNFINVLELQSIDGFDPKTIEYLLPFITLEEELAYEPFRFKNIFRNAEQDLMIRYGRLLEQQKGFTDLPGNRYLGNPDKFQLRYRYQYENRISAAFTTEKDAGEKWAGQPMDFISGNLALYQIGRIKKLVLGDYTLQFGQGLTLWSGFSFGKGPDVASITKKDLGLRPYTSTNEYSFFRGISTTVQFNQHIDLTPFVSFRKLDVSQDLDGQEQMVQATVNQTGLHRTSTEMEHRNTLSQLIYGGTIQYQRHDLTIGGIVYHTKYGNSFITQDAPYDRFGFTGNSLTNIGLYYNYAYKNIYFFGESGKSLKSGLALLHGALISLAPIISMAVAYRNYDRDYHNFFNQATAESTEAVAESGLYAGLNINPSKKWSFSAYADYFKFPWLKFRVDAPSNGREWFSQLTYSPNKRFKISARFKSEIKSQNTDMEMPVNYLEDVKRENYRIEMNCVLDKKFSFQNRLEIAQYQKGDPVKEYGFLIFQDVKYAPMFSRITGNVRVAYFQTKSYNSRIYAYEDDVLYSFAFGMYSGKGFRTYLNLKYRLSRTLNIWLRYAVFIYKNQSKVGSYLDEIQGNKKSEVKFQLRYQF